MYTVHTRFCTFGADLYAQSELISKISASELSQKFIKSELSVGKSHQLYLNPIITPPSFVLLKKKRDTQEEKNTSKLRQQNCLIGEDDRTPNLFFFLSPLDLTAISKGIQLVRDFFSLLFSNGEGLLLSLFLSSKFSVRHLPSFFSFLFVLLL